MDINDIISGLSQEDIDNLKAMAENMFSQEEPEKKSSGSEPVMPDLGSILGNAQMISRLSSIMSAMNKRDERTQLIEALKPLLSEKRRKRADEAMQMMKLFDLLPMISETTGGEKNE